MSPMPIPFNKSVKRTPTMVRIKGMNWSIPFTYISLNNPALVNLYPTIIKIPASEAKGI